MPNSNDKFKSAIEVLNNFRNKYYSDTSGTEKYVVANAINEILPTFCKLTDSNWTVSFRTNSEEFRRLMQKYNVTIRVDNCENGKFLVTFCEEELSPFKTVEEIYEYLRKYESNEAVPSCSSLVNEIISKIKETCQTINTCCTRCPPFLTQNASFYKLNISLLESLVDILNRQGFNTEVVTRRITQYTDVFIIKSVKINTRSYEKVLEFDIPTDGPNLTFETIISCKSRKGRFKVMKPKKKFKLHKQQVNRVLTITAIISFISGLVSALGTAGAFDSGTESFGTYIILAVAIVLLSIAGLSIVVLEKINGGF